MCPDGEIGRRSGLKIRRPQGRGGSSPPPGTNIINYLQLNRPPTAGGHFYLMAVLMAVDSDRGTRLAKEPSQWLFDGCSVSVRGISSDIPRIDRAQPRRGPSQGSMTATRRASPGLDPGLKPRPFAEYPWNVIYSLLLEPHRRPITQYCFLSFTLLW